MSQYLFVFFFFIHKVGIALPGLITSMGLLEDSGRGWSDGRHVLLLLISVLLFVLSIFFSFGVFLRQGLT